MIMNYLKDSLCNSDNFVRITLSEDTLEIKGIWTITSEKQKKKKKNQQNKNIRKLSRDETNPSYTTKRPHNCRTFHTKQRHYNAVYLYVFARTCDMLAY